MNITVKHFMYTYTTEIINPAALSFYFTDKDL